MTGIDNKTLLSESIKKSLKDSGALADLKQVSFDDPSIKERELLTQLKGQAKDAIDEIQKLLDSGILDDASAKKLSDTQAKLKSAIKGPMTAAALAAVLSEANNVLTGADASGKNGIPQATKEQLWQRVDAYNKEIDDDFDKMRKAGMVFNDKLWNRHKELGEYLKAHPHDIGTQKELDAVDDAMLLQADGQVKACPGAKDACDDAKQKSADRHKVVDKDLAGVSKNEAAGYTMSMADIDSYIDTSNHLTIDDITIQSIGQKQKPSGKQHS